MKKNALKLFAVAVFAISSFVITTAYSADANCMRPGKGKTVNDTFYCPYEGGTVACYYKIDCADAGNGGGIN